MINQSHQHQVAEEKMQNTRNISIEQFLVLIRKQKYSTSNSQNSDNQLTEKQVATRIINFIIKKINERASMSSKQFVSMFNMLIHIKITVSATLHHYKYRQHFYKAVSIYVTRALHQWTGCDKQPQKLKQNHNFASLLCSLSTLIKLKHQQNLDMELSHIFNPSLVRAVLTIRFPNEQRLLKIYKVLIFYIYKVNREQLYTQLMLKSLAYHLVECTSSKATQITVVYILNSLINKIKVKTQKQAFWNSENRSQILKSLLKILSGTLTHNQFKCILQLYAKIIGQNPSQISLVVSKDQIWSLFESLETKNNFLEKLPLSLKITLQKMSKQDQYSFFQQKLKQNQISAIVMQAVEICSRSIDGINFMNMIEGGNWQRILYFYHKFDNSMWHIKGYLHKTIQNMVTNSSFCKDLKETFQILAIQSQIFKYKKTITY